MSSSSSQQQQQERAWEGLGGPVRVSRPTMDDIDPTLDACCRREEESIRKGNALKQTLQKHDVVAEKERRRRNLVSFTNFQGCRCCYDPNHDGGEYPALTELRAEQRQENHHVDRLEREEKKELDDDYVEREHNNSNNDSDSDDEFDYLLDEDLPGQTEELAALEAARRAELELQFLDKEAALQHGYGVHRQMHPSRIFPAAGLVLVRNTNNSNTPPAAAVIHLVGDPLHSTASASLDLYLEQLATQYPGTKFMRAAGRTTLLQNAELATKVLPRLGYERDLPALIAVRDGVAINICPRLQGLVDYSGPNSAADEDGVMICPDAVYQWLSRSGVLFDQLPHHAVCRIRPEEEALMDYLLTMKPPPTAELEEERYDCGVADCHKTFPHEHVGIQNEQQQGLVVAQETVVDVAAQQTTAAET